LEARRPGGHVESEHAPKGPPPQAKPVHVAGVCDGVDIGQMLRHLIGVGGEGGVAVTTATHIHGDDCKHRVQVLYPPMFGPETSIIAEAMQQQQGWSRAVGPRRQYGRRHWTLQTWPPRRCSCVCSSVACIFGPTVSPM